ncbi:MAG: hypothetical protein ACI9NT_002390, partial [Bacteroidia bacterium]
LSHVKNTPIRPLYVTNSLARKKKRWKMALLPCSESTFFPREVGLSESAILIFEIEICS